MLPMPDGGGIFDGTTEQETIIVAIFCSRALLFKGHHPPPPTRVMKMAIRVGVVEAMPSSLNGTFSFLLLLLGGHTAHKDRLFVIVSFVRGPNKDDACLLLCVCVCVCVQDLFLCFPFSGSLYSLFNGSV